MKKIATAKSVSAVLSPLLIHHSKTAVLISKNEIIKKNVFMNNFSVQEQSKENIFELAKNI